MSSALKLSDDLRMANARLAAVGPRAVGDPGALRSLAQRVRQEADTVAAGGRLQAAVPDGMVFEGPAARRLAANAGEVAESLFVSSRRLDHVADAIVQAAERLHDAQADHDRLLHTLTAERDAIQRRIPGPIA